METPTGKLVGSNEWRPYRRRAGPALRPRPAETRERRLAPLLRRHDAVRIRGGREVPGDREPGSGRERAAARLDASAGHLGRNAGLHRAGRRDRRRHSARRVQVRRPEARSAAGAGTDHRIDGRDDPQRLRQMEGPRDHRPERRVAVVQLRSRRRRLRRSAGGAASIEHGRARRRALRLRTHRRVAPRNSRLGVGPPFDEDAVAVAIGHFDHIRTRLPQDAGPRRRADARKRPIHRHGDPGARRQDANASRGAGSGPHPLARSRGDQPEGLCPRGALLAFCALVIAWHCDENPGVLAGALDACQVRRRPSAVGISREELARALDYAPEYMSDAANGRDVPSILRSEPITGARFDELWRYLETG